MGASNDVGVATEVARWWQRLQGGVKVAVLVLTVEGCDVTPTEATVVEPMATSSGANKQWL